MSAVRNAEASASSVDRLQSVSRNITAVERRVSLSWCRRVHALLVGYCVLVWVSFVVF